MAQGCMGISDSLSRPVLEVGQISSSLPALSSKARPVEIEGCGKNEVSLLSQVILSAQEGFSQADSHPRHLPLE